jgi:transposase InsO family protein
MDSAMVGRRTSEKADSRESFAVTKTTAQAEMDAILAPINSRAAVPSGSANARDGVYGEAFRRRVESLGIEEVLTAARSPWQNPYAERLIGSIRRECLNHLVILSVRHLKRMLREYFDYYNRSRTHLALAKDSPTTRSVMLNGDIKDAEVRGWLEARNRHG